MTDIVSSSRIGLFDEEVSSRYVFDDPLPCICCCSHWSRTNGSEGDTEAFEDRSGLVIIDFVG